MIIRIAAIKLEIQNFRPRLSRLCRSMNILGHDYESVVDCVLFLHQNKVILPPLSLPQRWGGGTIPPQHPKSCKENLVRNKQKPL